MENDQRRDVVLAWTIANFSKAAKLPPLDTLLRGLSEVEPPTDEDVRMTKQIAEEAVEILRRRRERKKQHGR